MKIGRSCLVVVQSGHRWWISLLCSPTVSTLSALSFLALTCFLRPGTLTELGLTWICCHTAMTWWLTADRPVVFKIYIQTHQTLSHMFQIWGPNRVGSDPAAERCGWRSPEHKKNALNHTRSCTRACQCGQFDSWILLWAVRTRHVTGDDPEMAGE